eukprot:TRINITY_DN23495_c0_g1_i2.p2 TRINITY_DN23495_c0_g1~~TRINITY_DN23495_c0_g1_i2.p2  ORF type:complete len:114 (-),score=10.90 TRINITY_DN23495_c0_g1_i2:137-442(-)
MPTWGSSVTKFTWIFVAIVVSAELKSAWDDRQRRLAIQRRRELEKLMKVEPREEWHESDLKLYNGEDPTGPILIGIRRPRCNTFASEAIARRLRGRRGPAD